MIYDLILYNIILIASKTHLRLNLFEVFLIISLIPTILLFFIILVKLLMSYWSVYQ